MWKLKKLQLTDKDIERISRGEAPAAPELPTLHLQEGSPKDEISPDDFREKLLEMKSNLSPGLLIPLGIVSSLMQEYPALEREPDMHRLSILFSSLVQSMQDQLLHTSDASSASNASPAGSETPVTPGFSTPPSGKGTVRRRQLISRGGKTRAARKPARASRAPTSSEAKPPPPSEPAAGTPEESLGESAVDSPLVREIIVFCRTMMQVCIEASEEATQSAAGASSSDNDRSENGGLQSLPEFKFSESALDYFGQAAGGALTAAAASGRLSGPPS